MKTRYAVEHFTLCDGWVNTWKVNDEPQLLDTREDAQAELDEFLSDIQQEIACGARGLDEGYDPDEFRIVEVTSVTGGMTNEERADHAAEGLAAYLRSKGEYDSPKPLHGFIEDHEVSDLLCDLLHLGDRLGLPHRDVIERALAYYEPEAEETEGAA